MNDVTQNTSIFLHLTPLWTFKLLMRVGETRNSQNACLYCYYYTNQDICWFSDFYILSNCNSHNIFVSHICEWQTYVAGHLPALTFPGLKIIRSYLHQTYILHLHCYINVIIQMIQSLCFTNIWSTIHANQCHCPLYLLFAFNIYSDIWSY